MDYTEAVRLTKEYNAKIQDMISEYNVKMETIYKDNYVGTPTDELILSPQFLVERPTAGAEFWFHGTVINHDFYQIVIDGVKICEDVSRGDHINDIN